MIKPFLADATSSLEFSMNHAGLRKVIGTDTFLSACSMIVCCESSSMSCLPPIVDRYTTTTRARRVERPIQSCRLLRVLPENRARIEIGRHQNEYTIDPLECSRQSCSIINIGSHQCAATLRPDFGFVDIANHSPHSLTTGQRLRATSPPTWPVIPGIANICYFLLRPSSSCDEEESQSACIKWLTTRSH